MNKSTVRFMSSTQEMKRIFKNNTSSGVSLAACTRISQRWWSQYNYNYDSTTNSINLDLGVI